MFHPMDTLIKGNIHKVLYTLLYHSMNNISSAFEKKAFFANSTAEHNANIAL